MGEPPDVISLSFIIKVWIEEMALEGRPARWRGHITAVPSGDRKYVQDLAGINSFVESYLEPLGVAPSPLRRLQKTLEQWTHIVQTRVSRLTRHN